MKKIGKIKLVGNRGRERLKKKLIRKNMRIYGVNKEMVGQEGKCIIRIAETTLAICRRRGKILPY